MRRRHQETIEQHGPCSFCAVTVARWEVVHAPAGVRVCFGCAEEIERGFREGAAALPLHLVVAGRGARCSFCSRQEKMLISSRLVEERKGLFRVETVRACACRDCALMMRNIVAELREAAEATVDDT
jgi:hypothetical protein